MELSDEMLKEISYVKISTYRTKVMKSLDGDVKIPTAIAKDSGIMTNHISKVLSELKAHELVECINPEVRKGRLYRHTDKGEQVVKNLE
ncbi:transcriptional regulator [Methanobrevibacter sp. YE315]|uniref:transcriptional regulator n=1 Tax=Methanobrevibacter sp. YE315 TaxID=1609968 RepID=UPI000764D0F2|nr:transcriptional regulator [Methanobrevibacter sp. YE315]AMD18029.1 transcriptional regulator [Methanobrevibacter sp. YE315]